MLKIILSIPLLLLCLAGPAAAQQEFTGLWIDNRTGNDFWEINGTDEGFRFTAYGGSPAEPRYLSRGVALALEPGQMHATVRDLPGYCCGQQGRLSIRQISASQLQIDGHFWPIGQEDKPQPTSFTLTREGTPLAGLTPESMPLPSIIYEFQSVGPPPGPTTATWNGSWQGDGWASFFISQEDNRLFMYWYYSEESPFYGLYTLAEDGLSAQGVALALSAKPGNTFYQHQLSLTQQPLAIKVSARRLAAPLEDGNWVTWENAPTTSFSLQKISDQLPSREQAHLRKWFAGQQPEGLLQQTLKQAEASGQLLKRNYE